MVAAVNSVSGLGIGIDIGGTGIKGALVNVATGELVSDRLKVATPVGGEPADIVAEVSAMVDRFGDRTGSVPVGVCFPAIVRGGRTMSAANVSKAWIGLEAEALFEASLHRDIHFVNDADAAGVAELHFGAAKGRDGLVILTTLGTGIGSAFIYNGVIQPNTELGFLQLDGAKVVERTTAYSAMEREQLSWKQWSKRLHRFYTHLERVFSPDLFIIGGGVSKSADDFLPLLDLKTPVVTAVHRNNAGILGAAVLAAEDAARGV